MDFDRIRAAYPFSTSCLVVPQKRPEALVKGMTFSLP
jgi:hypothetical protein